MLHYQRIIKPNYFHQYSNLQPLWQRTIQVYMFKGCKVLVKPPRRYDDETWT
jgi:hypothetical protein